MRARLFARARSITFFMELSMALPPDLVDALWTFFGAVIGWFSKWLHGKMSSPKGSQ